MMNMDKLYNQTQEVCNFLERKGFADLSPKIPINKVINAILERCPVACEFASEDKLFYRGGLDEPPDVQYIKPSLKKRVSRDNKNMWNVLFDNSPHTHHHQKRQRSLMFTTDEDVAREFGNIVYVFPVGNPLITYSPLDFIEMFPITKFETSIFHILELLKVSDGAHRRINQILSHGKDYNTILKVLKIIEQVPLKTNKFDMDRYPWSDHTRSEFLNKKLNGNFVEYVINKLNSDEIETLSLSNFNKFGKSKDELWTMAPCFLVDGNMLIEIQKRYKKQ
jgi:hypothetical protein